MLGHVVVEHGLPLRPRGARSLPARTADHLGHQLGLHQGDGQPVLDAAGGVGRSTEISEHLPDVALRLWTIGIIVINIIEELGHGASDSDNWRTSDKTRCSSRRSCTSAAPSPPDQTPLKAAKLTSRGCVPSVSARAMPSPSGPVTCPDQVPSGFKFRCLDREWKGGWADPELSILKYI